MLERGLKYHENKYHLYDVSTNQCNSYFKDIIVNYEDTSKNEWFDDKSTIEWSISGNNTSKYVAEYFQTNSLP